VNSGLIYSGNSIYAVNSAFVPCQPNTNNFVYLTLTPVIQVAANQSGFPSSNCLPIAVVLTGSREVLDLQDFRPDWNLNQGSGGGGGGSGTVSSVTLTGQTGGIGTTTLYSVPGASPGMYAVYADIIVSQAGTGGTIQVNVSWNNGVTNAGLNSAPLQLNVQQEQAALLGNFFVPAGQTISYSVTLTNPAGSPQYQLSLRLVYLG